jgi:hypothetical protein
MSGAPETSSGPSCTHNWASDEAPAPKTRTPSLPQLLSLAGTTWQSGRFPEEVDCICMAGEHLISTWVFEGSQTSHPPWVIWVGTHQPSTVLQHGHKAPAWSLLSHSWAWAGPSNHVCYVLHGYQNPHHWRGPLPHSDSSWQLFSGGLPIHIKWSLSPFSVDHSLESLRGLATPIAAEDTANEPSNVRRPDQTGPSNAGKFFFQDTNSPPVSYVGKVSSYHHCPRWTCNLAPSRPSFLLTLSGSSLESLTESVCEPAVGCHLASKGHHSPHCCHSVIQASVQ